MKAIFALLLVCVLSVQASFRPQVADSELFGTEELALLANLPVDVEILKGLIAEWRSVNLVNGANVVEAIKATFNASQNLIAQLDVLTHGWVSALLNSSKFRKVPTEEQLIAIVNTVYEVLPEVLSFKAVAQEWKHVNFLSGAGLKQAIESTLNNTELIFGQVDAVAHHKISNLLAKYHLTIAQVSQLPHVQLALKLVSFLYDTPAGSQLNTLQALVAVEKSVVHGDLVGALNQFTTVINSWKAFTA